ncbi:MAG TPA: Mut7-C RNAse domain-containing protein [Nitrospirota bacterium]|nr:Mut7-C RNAse domain-containing protein [Nitrospirota bacterium]
MKFAADAMLGKLARWLRLMGYDTFYLRDIGDDELLRVAHEEGRLLITRDTRLVKRLRPGEYLFIRDNAPLEQVRQAVGELGLKVGEEALFSRCTLCNEPLADAEKESVLGMVPEYTYNRVESFRSCASCGRVYWPGTHAGRVLERLKELSGGHG